MFAKVAAEVVMKLTTAFASWAWRSATAFFKRKKRIEKTETAAEELENAKSPEDIRAAADNMP